MLIAAIQNHQRCHRAEGTPVGSIRCCEDPSCRSAVTRWQTERMRDYPLGRDTEPGKWRQVENAQKIRK
jgi:hypothetical protein